MIVQPGVVGVAAGPPHKLRRQFRRQLRIILLQHLKTDIIKIPYNFLFSLIFALYTLGP